MMSVELMTAVAKLIGVLVLIIGGLLAFNVYARRFFKSGGGGGRKALRVLESTPLGMKKTITLVKVPGAVLVLGVTNDRITLLERMDERDYDALTASQPITHPHPTFQDHLRRLTGGWQRTTPGGDRASESTPC